MTAGLIKGHINNTLLFFKPFQRFLRTGYEPIALKQDGAIGDCPGFAITRRWRRCHVRVPLRPSHVLVDVLGRGLSGTDRGAILPAPLIASTYEYYEQLSAATGTAVFLRTTTLEILRLRVHVQLWTLCGSERTSSQWAAEAKEAEPFSLLYRLVLLLWKVAALALPVVVVWVGHGRWEEARHMSN